MDTEVRRLEPKRMTVKFKDTLRRVQRTFRNMDYQTRFGNESLNNAGILVSTNNYQHYDRTKINQLTSAITAMLMYDSFDV